MKGIKQNISDLLKELNLWANRVTASDAEVPSIEADILLSLLQQLYVNIEKLKVPELSGVVHETEPAAEPPRQEPAPEPMPVFIPPVVETAPEPPHAEVVIPEPEIQTVVQPEIRTEIREEAPVVPTPVVEPLQEIRSEPVFTPPPAEPPVRHVKPADHQPDLFGQAATLNKPLSDVPSINEKITAGKNDLTLSDKMNLKPISDLKATIGINEKFQFVNELFDGSTEMYNQAITQLNSCLNAQQAEALFNGMQIRNSWDEANPAFVKLHEYVTRRYLQA